MEDLDNLKQLFELRLMCKEIYEKGGTEIILDKLQSYINSLPIPVLQNIQPILISCFYPFLDKSQANLSEDYRKKNVDTLSLIFSKTTLNVKNVFFNVYGFLVNEIYDSKNTHKVNNVRIIHEEYKLSIINCVTNLSKSLSWDLILEMYVKENVIKFCPILQVCLCLAKNERLRPLRIAAIQCIMTIAKVDDSCDITDSEIRSQVSDIFVYFLPGIAAGLVHICVEDEKAGHKVALIAVRAWGRLVTLLMQNYNAIDEYTDILEELSLENKVINNEQKPPLKKIDDILNSVKKNAAFYKQHDIKLELCVNQLKKLTSHQHPKVRNELVDICGLLVNYCIRLIPNTVSRVIEILISLSEDEYEETSKKACGILVTLSNDLIIDNLQNKFMLNKLECIFFNTITTLPRIFNGLDERQQLTTLNLLIGFLRLFGNHTLKQILFTPTNLHRLIISLMHIAELQNNNISLLEEYTIQELDLIPDLRTPWKIFKFHEDGIQTKLEIACHLLDKPEVSDIVIDFLTDVYLNDFEHRKEATLVLNEILSVTHNNFPKIKEIIYMYLEHENWNLPLIFENNLTKIEIQNNIIQICLQLEGIGKMALALKLDFHDLLLKVLYVVLEKAGSGQPLLKAAGLLTIVNISVACGYNNVTELINKNADYFSYHVVRKIKYAEHNESVLNVLAVVMKYSNMDVLETMSDIVEEVLIQTCDKFQEKNANAYLRVFQIFMKCLHRWLKIEIHIEPMKSRLEKEKEIEDFRITNMEKLNNDFSDGVMDKSAEEMFNEDMNKNKDELDEDDEPEISEYKKPEPPMHIKLSVSILKICLNFLPSKDISRKLLALEILKDGLEIIRDFEDELLPIVHLIWSPLVNRFKEFDNPLIINLSFQLLLTLAKLSKDFIRLRTIKDVLPQVCEILQLKSKESYLKDKGAAYRFTQNYKMQLTLLSQFSRLVYYIDLGEDNLILVATTFRPYLSDKQPIPLQEASIEFFQKMKTVDCTISEKLITKIEELCMFGNDLPGDTEWNKNINTLRSSL